MEALPETPVYQARPNDARSSSGETLKSNGIIPLQGLVANLEGSLSTSSELEKTEFSNPKSRTLVQPLRPDSNAVKNERESG